MNAMLEDKFMTVAKLAMQAGCTESYVRWLIRNEKLEYEQIGQKTYLIPIKAAEKFIATPRTTGRPRKNPKK